MWAPPRPWRGGRRRIAVGQARRTDAVRPGADRHGHTPRHDGSRASVWVRAFAVGYLRVPPDTGALAS